MTQVIRDNKTIKELQAEEDYEWKDGDDSALYDAGYEDGVLYAIGILDSVLAQKESVSDICSGCSRIFIHKFSSRSAKDGEYHRLNTPGYEALTNEK